MYGIAQLGEYSIATRRSPADERPKAVDELFAAGIPLGRARKVCERVTLDRMDEPARLPDCGNQVVPASAGEMTLLMGDRRELGGDRIQSAKVVEQPAVDAVSRQRRLDGRDVNRRHRDSRGHGVSIASQLSALSHRLSAVGLARFGRSS